MIDRNSSIGFLKIIRTAIRVVIALLVLLWALLEINTFSSKYWPTTDGTLDNLSLKKEYYKGKYRNYMHLSYSYNIANINYKSNRFDCGFMTVDDYGFISDYTKQQKILKVYYNPIVNSISVLKPGYAGFSFLPFVLLLFPLVMNEQVSSTIKNLEGKRLKDEANDT